MGTVIFNAAAVFFTAIYFNCALTNAQDCDEARNVITRREINGVNCSSLLSRVYDTIAFRFDFINATDLSSICTSSNTTVCQDEVTDYFEFCGPLDRAVSEEERAISYGCTINLSSGSYCAINLTVPIYFRSSLEGLFSSCIRSYFDGFCRSSCFDLLQSYTLSAGCCYNEAMRTFFGNSTRHTEDEYEIVANNYFTMCNLTNPGFCRGTPEPISSCSQSLTELFQNQSNDNCSQAVQRLQLNNHDNMLSIARNIPGCLELYLAYLENCNDFTSSSSERESQRACLRSAVTLFGQNSYTSCVNNTDAVLDILGSFRTRNLEDIAEIQSISEIMCRIPGCMNNVNNYVGSCNIQNNITNLLCYGSNRRSCLAIQQTGILQSLGSSFSRYGSPCFATVVSTCPSACKEIITEAIDTTGCCAYEYIRYLTLRDNITHVNSADQLFEACSVESGRCGLVSRGDGVIAYSLSVGTFLMISTLLSM